MKKVQLMSALILCLGINQIFAGARFYSGSNCLYGQSFFRTHGGIENLNHVEYTYSCIKNHDLGTDARYSLDYPAACTDHFGDDITSVKVTGETVVILYEHPNYKGESIILNDSGCWSLGWINNKSSSVIIYR